MKITTIIGARPQFIKAATVSRTFLKINNIQEIIIHTGQHFDSNMSDVFFEEMEIPKPIYNLNINSLSHGAMTGQMIEKIENILLMEKPDWVLLYGDTNSTLAGTIAAKKLHIKIAHVEAGLRMFEMRNPEEINRIVTDRLSDILFCPSQIAINNLIIEGFNNFGCQIVNSGDVMYDAALFYKNKAKKPKGNLPEKFHLCTMHRAENTDNIINLKSIISALETISKITPVLFPIHPRTKNILKSIDYNFNKSNIIFIEPIGYLEMIWLLKNCNLVFTDSGGIQKEAYFFEKYSIIFNTKTPWIELNEMGYNRLVGSNKEDIIESFNFFSNMPKSGFGLKLYGQGDASKKITEHMISYCN
mgnify:CR=1 FL=1